VERKTSFEKETEVDPKDMKLTMPKPLPHLLVLGVMLLLPFVFGQENNSSAKWELTGRVTSETEEPLAGVRVGDQTTTDEDGRFSISLTPVRSGGETGYRAVRFQMKNFQTVTKMVAPGTRQLNLVMHRGNNKWFPPYCDLSFASPPLSDTISLQPAHWFGGLMRFPMIKSPELTRVDDVDYTSVWIRYESNQGIETMMWGTGPTWSSGSPSPLLLAFSTEVHEQEIGQIGQIRGVDFWGRDSNGKKWRYTGTLFESISYENVSDEAAALFDTIIGKMCLDSAAIEILEKGSK
jgi:hypothetical protein